MAPQAATDNDVRLHIYREFLARGAPPGVRDAARALKLSEAEVAAAYDRLASGRVIVLRPGTHDIVMAAPLSAVPTRFVVRVGDERSYYANCIWDGLGVLAMLGATGVVDALCGDCDEPLALRVRDGRLEPNGAVVHFAIPAARWWEDIVFT